MPASISFLGRYDIVPLILTKLVRLITEGKSVRINIWDADLECLAKRSLQDGRWASYASASPASRSSASTRPT